MNAFRTLLAAVALMGTGTSASAAPLAVVNQGESQQISYSDSRFAQHAAGIPVFTGGSEGDVAYLPAAPSTPQIAAR
jgi:hypothetical protein